MKKPKNKRVKIMRDITGAIFLILGIGLLFKSTLAGILCIAFAVFIYYNLKDK